MLRPLVTEFLNSSGVHVGLAARSYVLQPQPNNVDSAWTVKVFNVVTGKPAYYAECSRGNEVMMFSKPNESRHDTLDWFCAFVNEQLQKLVDA